MIHRNLLIYSLILSVSLMTTAANFMMADRVSAQAKAASPSPTATVSPTPDPSATPTVSPSPLPEPKYEPVGDKIRLWQLRWVSEKNTNQPIAPVVKKAKEKTNKTKKTSWFAGVAKAERLAQNSITEPNRKNGISATSTPATGGTRASSKIGTIFIPAAAVSVLGSFFGSYFRGKKQQPNRVQACVVKEEFKAGKHSLWNSYQSLANATIGNGGEFVTGQKKVDESYIVSNVFTAAEGDAGRFTDLTILYDEPDKNALKISYRASNEPLPAIHAPADWIDLPDPQANSAESCTKNVRIAKYPLDVTKKYFQYKVNVVKGQEFRAAWFDIQGMKALAVEPTPNPTASADPSKDGDTGLLSITTKKLVTVAATATPSAALLPPSPIPSATPSNVPAKPNPACFSNQNTEPAANVPIALRQIEGGSTKVEDEQTDEDGLWSGVNEEQDDFPVGTYLLKWGDFEKNEYKLVDICVSPNDGTNIKYSGTSISGDARATFSIKKDQETKITLLYAKRDNPYIAMTKFAVNQQNKIIRLIYPGSNFRYLIRYENTGEADALDVVIRDVIPQELYVVGSESQDIKEKATYDVELDALGRTIITRRLGKLVRGQRGSLIIPVIARPTAFGLPASAQEQMADQARGEVPAGEQAPPSDRLPTDFMN